MERFYVMVSRQPQIVFPAGYEFAPPGSFGGPDIRWMSGAQWSTGCEIIGTIPDDGFLHCRPIDKNVIWGAIYANSHGGRDIDISKIEDADELDLMAFVSDAYDEGRITLD